MASVNKWIGIGNLGADPEIRVRPGGESICNLRIACTEQWRDKATGERKESTEWVRVAFFGRLADVAGQYLRKGSQVYIEGRLKTRKYQDQSGQDRYITEIRGDEMKMLGGRGDAASAPAPQREAPPRQEPRRQAPPPQAQGGFGDFDDDIPF